MSERQVGPCSETDCYCRCTWARNGSCPACLHDVTPTADLVEECTCPSAWITAGGGCQCPIPPASTDRPSAKEQP